MRNTFLQNGFFYFSLLRDLPGRNIIIAIDDGGGVSFGVSITNLPSRRQTNKLTAAKSIFHRSARAEGSSCAVVSRISFGYVMYRRVCDDELARREVVV